jgi:hypothetical protein
LELSNDHGAVTVIRFMMASEENPNKAGSKK